MSYNIQLKFLDRYVSKAVLTPPLSRHCLHFSTITKGIAVHYNLGKSCITILKGYCLGIHKHECSCTLSYTFDVLGEMLTGRQFSTLALSFFL